MLQQTATVASPTKAAPKKKAAAPKAKVAASPKKAAPKASPKAAAKSQAKPSKPVKESKPKKVVAKKAASPAKPKALKSPPKADSGKIKKVSVAAGSAHPKYLEMVVAALASLKERGGSSRQAIHKYIVSNYSLGSDVKQINTYLKMALKRGVDTGAIKHVKGQGASGSFKVAPKNVEKKEKKPKVKKPKAKKAGKKTTKAAAKPKAAAPSA